MKDRYQRNQRTYPAGCPLVCDCCGRGPGTCCQEGPVWRCSATWCYHVRPTPEMSERRRGELLAVLARSFHPLTTSEIQDVVRGTPSDVKRYLDALARKGQVTKISAGSAHPCLWELKVSTESLERRGIL